MTVPPMFTCDRCGGTFPKAWTDAEAAAEAESVFGSSLGADPAVVCDDCYLTIIRRAHQ